ncbi:MAG: hypothetical protein VR70_10945 [Rhodospirillaceae bacterium BRH_c57]|nr:MAG: hypothetical protein VR70_10945 [Rhodospirillaceae bacterium BRH_c57]
MFQIIAVIVAIALGGLISVGWASGFGDTFFEKRVEGDVSKYNNLSAQIKGALSAHKMDMGSYPSGCLTELKSDGYLQDIAMEIEDGNTWSCEADKLTVSGVSDDVCIAVLMNDGWESTGWTESDGVPSCPGDNTTTPYPSCCDDGS